MADTFAESKKQFQSIKSISVIVVSAGYGLMEMQEKECTAK
ncbi:hypothetical protein [Mucilaginibacter auburnensis]|nr:hypothetical protein [Mucilaginibacter auburnensis]